MTKYLCILIFAVIFSLWVNEATSQEYSSDSYILNFTQSVNEDSLARSILDLEGFVSRFSINSNRGDIARYLKSRLEAYGAEVSLDTFVMISPYNGESLLQYNVIGKISGTSNAGPVLIGAHYDSCCRPDSSPGADDNASGVAAVLEAARLYYQHSIRPRRTVYFCAWAAEEQGLLGSKDYATKLMYSNQKLALAINLDMVANSPDTAMKVNFEASATVRDKAKYFSSIDGTLSLIEGPSTGNSDHASFRAVGYPIVYYHEYSFSPNYHTAKDLFIYLNMAYCKRITQAAIATLIGFSNLPPAPEFIYAGNSGTGAGISLAWRPVECAEAYRVVVSNDSQILLDTLLASVYSLNYEGINASYVVVKLYSVDSLGVESLPNSKQFAITSTPLAIEKLTAIGFPDHISLTWTPPAERDLKEIILLQRPYFSNVAYDTVATIPPHQTYWDVYPDNSIPLSFKVFAVDSSGLKGFDSNEATTALARFDKGLLVISDATSNPFGMTADSIRRFFQALDSVVPTTVMSAPNVFPDIFQAYKMVLWHSTSGGLSQKMKSAIRPLENYLQNGGSLVVSTDYPQRLLNPANTANQSYYTIDPVNSFLHIQQSILLNGSLMEEAIGVSHFPTLRVDKRRVTTNQGNLNHFSSLVPRAPLVPIYTANTSTSQNAMNGSTVGIMSVSEPSMAVLAFPLAFMEYHDVAAFIRHIYYNVYQSTEEIPKPEFSSVKIFPNPVNNALTVSFSTDEASTLITVYNMYGKVMHSAWHQTVSPFENYRFELLVADYPPGIYVIRVGKEVKRFIKK